MRGFRGVTRLFTPRGEAFFSPLILLAALPLGHFLSRLYSIHAVGLFFACMISYFSIFSANAFFVLNGPLNPGPRLPVCFVPR